jgi:hypothetical protein
MRGESAASSEELEEHKECARKLYVLFLEPEVHQRNRSTSPRIVKKKSLPRTTFTVAPRCNSLRVRVSGFAA